MVCSMTVIVCSMLFAHFRFWQPLPCVHLDSQKAGYMRVHAGYMICQNDIFSNSSVVGHILIFTAMML